jgi:hypothetical protein
LVLLTNVVGANEQPGAPLAEVLIENKNGSVKALPLRLNFETASWKDSCSASAPCQTVYRWHKRMVLAGQNSFPDAWRDFQAGLHGTVLTLPPRSEVAKITIRYLSGSGRFYLWGIALAA